MAEGGSEGRNYTELIEQFCAITGGSNDIGQHLLEACNGDLQMAVGMHMDASSSAAPSSGQQPVPGGATGSEYEDEVRAPIPQKREVLVDRHTHQFQFGMGGRRRAPRSVFDGFRDFQAETRQAEERARRGERASSNKQRTLEDLFRPPIDIMHKGSFQSAKEAGVLDNKWLMVNIQNVQEFACQALNRDIWSQGSVRHLIKSHFIFWQVYSDSEDGNRFMQFYQIKKWPYVAIIDPQTGENFMEWNKFDAKTLIELVNTFLAEHPSPDGSLDNDSPPSKRLKKDSIVDASEDSQLKAAIQASLVSSTPAITLSSNSESDDSDDDLETFTDSGSEPEVIQELQKKIKSKDKSLKNIPSHKNKKTLSVKSTKTGVKNGLIDTNSNSSVSSLSRESSCTTSRKPSSSSVDPASSTLEDGSSSGLSSREPPSLKNEDSESCLDAPQAPSVSWREYLGPDTDEKTKLLIRFPDGKREPLTIPCSSKLKAVVEFISQEHQTDLGHHELVTNFPRRNLSDLDLGKTLQQCGLHPQETVFVQEKHS